jgi:hypothetical protein
MTKLLLFIINNLTMYFPQCEKFCPHLTWHLPFFSRKWLCLKNWLLDRHFLGGLLWCFTGVFAKNGCQNVVCWWSACGGMRGKAGQLTVTFEDRKMRHGFRIYFWALFLGLRGRPGAALSRDEIV